MADRIRTATATAGSRASSSSPNRCASTRSRAAVRTSTLAAHLLGFVNREGEGQYGVEQYYQDILGGRAARHRGRARRERRAVAGDARRSWPRDARRGHQPHDRRRPPAARRAGAARDLDRRPGQERVGRSSWIRTPARSTPRRRTRPTTRTSTERSRPTTRSGSSTRSCPASTSRVRVQDDDREGGARGEGTVG